MYAQEVNPAMVSAAVEELQAVIADQESECQQLFGDLRHTARRLYELSRSCEASDQTVDDLHWTADSLRTELQEARQILRGALDRLSEATSLLR
jgi:uncharacterized coiled-coil protein SlyX